MLLKYEFEEIVQKSEKCKLFFDSIDTQSKYIMRTIMSDMDFDMEILLDFLNNVHISKDGVSLATYFFKCKTTIDDKTDIRLHSKLIFIDRIGGKKIATLLNELYEVSEVATRDLFITVRCLFEKLLIHFITTMEYLK